MGVIFISHASQDNARAIAVRDWLRTNGWDQVFIDLDPGQGIAAGEHWQAELKRAGEACDAVLVLLSPHWVASAWCRAEFLVADLLGKKVFPIRVAPLADSEIPGDITKKYQAVDISTPDNERNGFERLRIGLKRAGLDPQSFEWPPVNEPQRAVYQGLRALDIQDAALFFGRDGDLTRALDTLRQMRDGAPKRMLSILGASGAGKSSFLRAGLIARLSRDELNFLVAPIVRPGRAALSGAQGLAACISGLTGRSTALAGGATELVEAFAAARRPLIDRFNATAAAAREAYAMKPPTIIIPIDQAEELFASDNIERPAFCAMLEEAVRIDGNVLIAATVRSDAYENLQNGLFSELQSVFTLPRVAQGSFQSIIEGPARLSKPPLRIAPALTQRLLGDLDSADALPLIAFTLERLYRAHGAGGELTEAHYDALGGVQGSIEAAIDDALTDALALPELALTRAELEALLRRAFIPWLATIDPDTHAPHRRVARIAELPGEAAPLIRLLIDQRLLSSDTRAGDANATVEPAHETLLRQWPLLQRWLDEEQSALATLESVKHGAQQWSANGAENAGSEWLEHRGLRLLAAEEIMARPDFSAVAGSHAVQYLAACRQAENSEVAREASRLEQMRLQVERNRRLQRRGLALLTVAFLALVTGVVGVVSVIQGLNQRRSDTLAALARVALDDGRADRAARYALAGVRDRNAPFVGFDASAAESLLRVQQQRSGALAALHHGGQVRSAFFSPDSRYVLTASYDRTAALWDARSGARIWTFAGHTQKVENAAFSHDGTLVATVSFDGTARIWRTDEDGALVHTLDHNEGRRRPVQLWKAVFSPDDALLATAASDGHVRVWDVATGRLIRRADGQRRRITDVAFSRDSREVYSASEDGDVVRWNARSGAISATFPRPDETTSGSTLFAISGDGLLLAIGYQNGALALWNLQTGAQVSSVQAHSNFIRQISFDTRSRWLLTASSDTQVKLWDATTLAPIREFSSSGRTRGAVFSPSGGRIVSVGDDGVARIWDTQTGARLFEYSGHEGSIWMANYAPNGSAFVTASADGQARIWTPDIRQDQLAITLAGHSKPVRVAAYSPDGRYVATASFESGDGTARVWEASSGRLLHIIPAGVTQAVAFSPDGHFLATAQVDTRSVRIWDWRACSQDGATSCEVGEPMQHGSRVMDVAFSKDGREIISASRDNLAQIWRLEDRRAPRLTFPHMAGAAAAAFSPNAARAVSVSYEDGYIWDTRTGAEICQLRGHTEAMRDVNFSHDGTRVVTASEDRTVRVWNAATCAQIGPAIQSPGDSIWSAQFSPDDSLIAVASEAFNEARIYDSQSHALVHVLVGHTGPVYAVSFSPDGQHVITASADLTAKIWSLPPRQALDIATLEEHMCAHTLAAGLSVFSEDELRNAPVLDAELDVDPCHPPSYLDRAIHAVGNGFRALIDRRRTS